MKSEFPIEIAFTWIFIFAMLGCGWLFWWQLEDEFTAIRIVAGLRAGPRRGKP